MNEVNLIRAAQNGEKSAFTDLVTLYYSYVFKFILKLSGDEHLAGDLTQDTFVKLIRSIERFDVYGKASFATYVMTIAKNTYIDHLRKNKQQYLNIEDIDIATKDEYFKGQEMEEILKVIDALSPNQAQAIRLKYIENFTLIQIAKIQNTEPKTIKSRIHNGVVKLRQLLKGGFGNG